MVTEVEVSRIPTEVAIPVKNHFDDLTGPLLLHLLDYELVDRIHVLDNGSTSEEQAKLFEVADLYPKVDVSLAPERTIYGLWKIAWRTALARWRGKPVNLAILNNDVRMLPDTLRHLGELLRADDGVWIVSPEYQRKLDAGIRPHLSLRKATGTFRHGGIAGFAFMVKAELAGVHGPLSWPPVDDRFQWWGGDDDLVWTIEKAGGTCGIALGLPLEHIGGATAADRDDLDPKIAQDRALLEFKWGAGTGW